VLTTCLLVYTDTLIPQFQLQHFSIVITYNVCLFVLFCRRRKKIHTVEENKQNDKANGAIAPQLVEVDMCIEMGIIVIQAV